MRSEQLTEAQLDALFERLRPTLAYLTRLQKRMDKRAFPDDDRLLLLVREAQNALQALCVEIHYLSCDNVGRPRRQDGH